MNGLSKFGNILTRCLGVNRGWIDVARHNSNMSSPITEFSIGRGKSIFIFSLNYNYLENPVIFLI